MVETIGISEAIGMEELRNQFNLQLIQDRNFFPEWFEQLPELSDREIDGLDRIKHRFGFYLEDALPEEAIKMIIISPLLEVAGFYDPPYKARFETPVQVTVESEERTYRGRLDTLIIQEQLWILLIEAKRASLSLAVAIPQALAYMIGNPYPDHPVYGLVTNGMDFQFLKLVKQETLQYARSDKFYLENAGDLYQVLRIMRRIAVAVLNHSPRTNDE